MALGWNVFRYLADASHTLSKIILIWSMHTNRSAEGVSLITQVSYLIVFIARYLPFDFIPKSDHSTFHRLWNTTLKLFYILSSAYIIAIMMRLFPRTREREKAWKLGAACLFGSLLAAPFDMMIFSHRSQWSYVEFSWVFSIILEAVCILPQLLLLRQTTVPTVIDSFYLLALGSYRALYILNWIVKEVENHGNDDYRFDATSFIFGLVQTALYIDFAWVYYSRQRVKLRSGVVVDSDDLSRGWLVKRLIGSGEVGAEDEEAWDNRRNTDGTDNTARRGWGRRGISVSADETLNEPPARRSEEGLADPEAFADEASDDDDTNDPASKPLNQDTKSTTVGNGSEWRNGATS